MTTDRRRYEGFWGGIGARNWPTWAPNSETSNNHDLACLHYRLFDFALLFLANKERPFFQSGRGPHTCVMKVGGRSPPAPLHRRLCEPPRFADPIINGRKTGNNRPNRPKKGNVPFSCLGLFLPWFWKSLSPRGRGARLAKKFTLA